jgi:hypothetical protein
MYSFILLLLVASKRCLNNCFTWRIPPKKYLNVCPSYTVQLSCSYTCPSYIHAFMGGSPPPLEQSDPPPLKIRFFHYMGKNSWPDPVFYSKRCRPPPPPCKSDQMQVCPLPSGCDRPQRGRTRGDWSRGEGRRRRAQQPAPPGRRGARGQRAQAQGKVGARHLRHAMQGRDSPNSYQDLIRILIPLLTTYLFSTLWDIHDS